MSTAYAIIRDQRPSNSDRNATVVRIVWTEEEAVRLVKHLNGLGAEGNHPYSWQETWVARGEVGTASTLTPRDRECLELARSHKALETERPMAVFFSFILNKSGALAACDELRLLGWPKVGFDEEATDDECWHVYGDGCRLVLSAASVAELRVVMEDLAEKHGGTFDGWDVSGGHGLRSRSGDLPT